MSGGKNVEVIEQGKQVALREISEQFGVVDTVRTLQKMMKEVTAKDVNADTVNAACNCVQNLNLTIKTAIQAARYLSDKNG
jgi:hypothetical protein